PKECATASHTVDNVLIEEWDGYTWRRVAGNGPLPGREVTNVVIRDTVPAGFTFDRFTGDAPLGIEPEVDGNVITWTIPKLQVKQKGTISYVATASGVCPMQDKTIMTRVWISADRESAISDSVAVTVTCDSVPPPPPPATTMYKRTDRPAYPVGDTVTYNITYKQTHGSIVSDASDITQWIDHGGNGTFSMSGDTITFDKSATTMVHSYSYGVNGTFGGTINPPYYSSFSLVARSSGADFVEIRFFKDYGDMRVQFFNNDTQVGGDQRFTYTEFSATPATFDFKVKLSGDTISLWAGDTTGPSPNVAQTGILVQPGYAGVKSVTNDNGQAQLWGWNSHMDVAYDVTIHDPLPSNITFISAGGSIITGPLAGRELTAQYNSGDITWPIVSGEDFLEANDSLSLWVKGTLDECTGDTIINTAFANIRGYPIDYIGARNKITCTTDDDGRPYHMDIILDPVNFDRTDDDFLDTLTLGASQTTYRIYAIVRDRYGNFLRFADQASWSSSDESIATILGAANDKSIGIISNVGSGTTIIRVQESDITGDSLALTVTTAPAWPAIQSAVMFDENGDNIPDLLTITLLRDFEDEQQLDSVTFSYNNDHYSIPAESITTDALRLSVPFTSRTGTDSRPTGEVTIHMSDGSSDKQSTKTFVDGVGPALSAASVVENLGTESDMLLLTFTEPVTADHLAGDQLLLIKENTTESITLTIDSVIDSLNERLFSVRIQPTTPRPAPGDALRLMPGSAGGSISDRNSNTPHDNNPSVELTLQKGPAAISWAAYFDSNADGYIDFVRVRFKRDVEQSEIDGISVHWEIQPEAVVESVSPSRISREDDSTYTIPADGAAVSPEMPLTDPDMDISITYVNFGDAPISSSVIDSTPPVAVSAKINPGVLVDEVRGPDTLEVVLSEPVKLTFGMEPFYFAHKNGDGQYYQQVTFVGLRETAYIFTLETDADEAPLYANGDSLWINPQGQVADLRGIAQRDDQNQRVTLEVDFPPVSWKVAAAPNHFSPAGRAESITIIVKPTAPVNLADVQVTCIIYDAVGNILFRKPMKTQNYEFQRIWDGRNQQKRLVGDGIYTAVFIIKTDDGETVEKMPIGVKN
ncbi:MAG: hypothetical protein ACOCW2_01950, partial [Chitinivibrionales bacterium]